MTCNWRRCWEWIRMPEVTETQSIPKWALTECFFMSYKALVSSFSLSPSHPVSWGYHCRAETKGNAHIWYRGNTTRVGMKWVLVFNSRMWRVVSWSMMKARSPYRRGSMAEGVKSLCWWATIFFHPFFFSSSYGSGDHTQGLTHARQALYHKLHP
jgi:hypothetical protein